MFILFLGLLLAAIAVNFISARLDLKKLEGVGLVIGAAAGIILAVEINKTSSKSSVNPYFLGTFLVIMCAGVPMAIGYGLEEWIKKRKK